MYIARCGDSLWTLTQRAKLQLPLWLLQQYNPEVDFSELRPGTQIVMPRVEEVHGQWLSVAGSGHLPRACDGCTCRRRAFAAYNRASYAL